MGSLHRWHCLFGSLSHTGGEGEGGGWRFFGLRLISLSSVFLLPLPDFFQELLAGAERSLQAMFARSYGRLYLQHARLFQGLFVELQYQLKGSRPGLDEALSDFWSQLLERMLPLLNPQYSFPEGYLECVGRQVESLHAFGDSPRQLRVQVSPAPDRTALRLGAEPLAGWEGERALSHSQQPGKESLSQREPKGGGVGAALSLFALLPPQPHLLPHHLPHHLPVRKLSCVKHSFRCWSSQHWK